MKASNSAHSQREISSAQIEATRMYLKAMCVVFWGLAVLLGGLKIAAFVNSTSFPAHGIWQGPLLSNDLFFWLILVLCPTLMGIGIWHMRKWGGLLFAFFYASILVDALLRPEIIYLPFVLTLTVVGIHLLALWQRNYLV